MVNRVTLKWFASCLIVSLCVSAWLAPVFAADQQKISASSATAFGDTILKKGARGGDVYELQGRLKLLGFYTGDVDGVFGHRTYLAVRLFQYEFGLKIDGVVGPKTKLKLWQSTKHWRPEMTNKKGPVLKRGNQGGGVWELQGRLKHIGFYTGKWDGNFGERTYRAVRLFQYEFGLKVDGVAGPKTMQKLRKATKNYAPETKWQQPQESKQVSIPKSSYGLSENDIHLLAQAVYAEGRGESYIGQVAIAAVILNRLESREFPDTISGIIFQPLAFEAVADGQIWMQPDETAKKAVRDALNGWDPTGGALYYFNPERATSKWIWNRPQIKKIGKHIFTR
ncbi:spore cortex-lytic enzyme [Thermoactinomyces vulgaris]|uniref:spore cortex-lytic enzyme n=1 Tax=Thermoactinomyces vulgaris TaxID=2026 RepID=UPI003629F24E